MKTITLAHVSDLHLPFEPKLGPRQRLSKRQLSAWAWRRRGNVQSAQILAALAAEMQAADLDHIVITGDLINFALPEEFERAASWLQALAPADRISVVPGNHDALVPLAEAEGLGRWSAWTSPDGCWPFVHRRQGWALIGLNSALPTAPLLACGRLGARQLARLETVLNEEARAGRIRVVAVHHPLARGAVNWRRALVDRAQVCAVLRRTGAELVLHGHAHSARLDALPGPHGTRGMIPCLCVPSSSALPNKNDEAARWHRLRFSRAGRVEVAIRQWSAAEARFVDSGCYEICLPRRMTDACSASAAVPDDAACDALVGELRQAWHRAAV
jgi:3',5'-cyclic AMP phosphodiesterase CpdA